MRRSRRVSLAVSWWIAAVGAVGTFCWLVFHSLVPYNAFISYNHSTDSNLAAALQSALHRFAKPWYKLRALHIFRDQTNLGLNPALWSRVRGALVQSLFSLLLASPEAGISLWVAKEAEYWLGKNGSSR